MPPPAEPHAYYPDDARQRWFKKTGQTQQPGMPMLQDEENPPLLNRGTRAMRDDYNSRQPASLPPPSPPPPWGKRRFMCTRDVVIDLTSSGNGSYMGRPDQDPHPWGKRRFICTCDVVVDLTSSPATAGGGVSTALRTAANVKSDDKR